MARSLAVEAMAPALLATLAVCNPVAEIRVPVTGEASPAVVVDYGVDEGLVMGRRYIEQGGGPSPGMVWISDYRSFAVRYDAVDGTLAQSVVTRPDVVAVDGNPSLLVSENGEFAIRALPGMPAQIVKVPGLFPDLQDEETRAIVVRTLAQAQ